MEADPLRLVPAAQGSTQVVLERLETPLGALLYAAAVGKLDALPPLRWSDTAAVAVVLAAGGYPASPRTGDVISGLDQAATVDGVYVLHAGTRREAGQVVSTGGRVLSVVGTGVDLSEARARVYEALGHIGLVGSHYRSDIAQAAAAADGRMAP